MLCSERCPNCRPRSYRTLCFEQGIALLEAERPADAVAALSAAIKETGVGPPVAEILVKLASAYAQSGQQEEAFRTLLQAADADPQRASECYRLAQTIGTAQVATAVWSWLKAERLSDWKSDFEKFGRYGDALLLAARVATAAGEHSPALDLLKQLAARGNSNDAISVDIAKQLDKVGDALMRAGEFKHAEEALQLAIDREPANGSRRLTLMDVLYRKSILPEAPFVNHADISRSVQVWEEALQHGSPRDGEAWAWTGRACINQQLARLPSCNRWKLGWEAAALCERGLAAQPEETWHWINLARWYRFLVLPACEDQVTKTLLDMGADETSTTTLDERIVFLSNTGQFDELQAVVDRRRQLEDSPWLSGVEGFAWLRRGKNRKAVSLAGKYLADQPDATWCRETRATAYRRMGKTAEAAADYEYILRHVKLNDIEGQGSLARASFHLGFAEGQVDRAIEIAEDYLNKYALPTEGMARIDLGFSYLIRGDLEKGRALIEEGVRAERNCHEVDELSRFELPWFEKALRSRLKRKALVQILNKSKRGIKASLNKRIPGIPSQKMTAEDELREMLAKFGSSSADGWLYIAAQAGIARLRTRERPQEAAEIYKSIQEHEPESFGLARAGLACLAQRNAENVDRSVASSEPDGDALLARIDEFFDAAQGEGSGYLPVSTPIAFAIGSSMVPEDTGENWILRKTYVPTMRARIQSQTGVLVPGVRIRGSSSDDANFYSIALLGIERPHYRGSVPAGEPEPLVYAMQQLETAILRHLDEFIDVEGAWKIAEEWSKAPRANKIVDAALSSVSERVHFSRLLRALVRDGVPLVHGGVILEVLRNTPITSVSLPAIARSIRLKMRDCLPGNGPDVLKINFDGELSMSAGPPGPRRALSSDPKAVHELIRHARSLVDEKSGDSHNGKVALVIENASIAPLVRRLLRYELPHVSVLAREEVP